MRKHKFWFLLIDPFFRSENIVITVSEKEKSLWIERNKYAFHMLFMFSKSFQNGKEISKSQLKKNSKLMNDCLTTPLSLLQVHDKIYISRNRGSNFLCKFFIQCK